MSDSSPLLECSSLSKSYGEKQLRVAVLKGVDLTVPRDTELAIVGASGSGKSTLLHLLGGLDSPDTGEVRVQGKAISALDEQARCLWRNQEVGFIYQFHHLLAEFTVAENIAMPSLISGKSYQQIRPRVDLLLDRSGLTERALHKPHELSGGERQRVAICRALVLSPSIILADEPTGNLDNATASRVAKAIFEIKSDVQATLIVATHDESLARKCARVLRLEDGRLHEPTSAGFNAS